jgi:hypothetical protein
MASEDQFGISNRFGSPENNSVGLRVLSRQWTLSALNANFRLTSPAGTYTEKKIPKTRGEESCVDRARLEALCDDRAG